jgi:eukaryotic-like serine/threonine-protein kinase
MQPEIGFEASALRIEILQVHFLKSIMALVAGTRLGRFEIIAPLGAGGMGEVYRARDERLAREVAIKVLPEERVADRERFARFQREARAIASLAHPNLLAIHDFETVEGISFAVTELLRGETLRQRLQRGRVPPREALQIAASIADGIAAAHTNGVIHRDVKPENIFITTDGQVKVLDFGLAHFHSGRGESDSKAGTSIQTEVGHVMGTAGYMSPEQVRGESVGPATDIFSIGCVLYEMLTGQRAFPSMTAVFEQDAQQSGSREIDRVLQRCLRKNAQERFQSARDLGFALRALDEKRAVPWKAITIAAVVAAILVFSAALLIIYQQKPINSIAVLPFANVSRDPDAEYLSDGMTETLMNDLSEISGLRVVPRASVFRFKGATDFHPAATKLKVRAVVMGRVLRRGNIIDVQAELIDAANERQLWGGRYDKPITDLVVIQRDIARDISDHLRLRLSPGERRRVTAPATANAASYEPYLKGRYYWNKRGAENLRTSIDYFRQATDADPEYALAYTGIADAYSLLGCCYADGPPGAPMAAAKAAALKAIELDGSLAEAHTSLAWILANYDWNLPAAEAEFHRAMALNPNYSTAHEWLAFPLVQQQKFNEAIAEITRARELDPLSSIINADVAWVYYFARRYPEAEQQALRSREIDPHFWLNEWELGLIHQATGQLHEAVADFQRSLAMSNGGLSERAYLARAYALAGKSQEARALLVEILRVSNERYVPPYYIALVYIGRGDHDRAFEWLQKAFLERSSAMMRLRTEPMLDSLRSDPRFADLVRRVDQARR